MELLFEVVNIWMMPWWVIWIWSPNSAIAGWLARKPIPLLLPVLVYVVLIGPGLPQLLPELANPKLGPITEFLSKPTGAFAGWIHFLVMDYLVGAWIVFRYQNSFAKANSWMVRAILFATLMFGPIGAVLSFWFLPVKPLGNDKLLAG